MKNILLISQKGGTGKTQISAEIVRSLQRTSTPSALFDIDQQGGILDPYKDEGAIVAVIDSPGQLQRQMNEWVKSSDVIVIPCRSSRQDIQPLLRTLQIVTDSKKPDTKIFIVLNCYNPRFKSSKDFLSSIRKLNTGAQILTLPESQIFVQAASMQKSAIDYKPKSDPAREALVLVNAIREAVGLPKETI